MPAHGPSKNKPRIPNWVSRRRISQRRAASQTLLATASLPTCLLFIGPLMAYLPSLAAGWGLPRPRSLPCPAWLRYDRWPDRSGLATGRLPADDQASRSSWIHRSANDRPFSALPSLHGSGDPVPPSPTWPARRELPRFFFFFYDVVRFLLFHLLS